MHVIIKEAAMIDTVGALRQALAAEPDDKPIGDVFGEPFCINWIQDKETGEITLEIN